VLATVATTVFAFMIRTGGTGDNETVPETTKPKWETSWTASSKAPTATSRRAT
jgi:hypothetical protein